MKLETILLEDMEIFMDSNSVTAGATAILAIITIWYAISTHKLLKETQVARKINAIEKILEKVYNPIEEAIRTLDIDLLEDPRSCGQINPDSIESIFLKFGKKLNEVRRNYDHLIDSDIINKHQNIWDISKNSFWVAYEDKELIEYKKLIEVFHRDILAKKHKYQLELADLQGMK